MSMLQTTYKRETFGMGIDSIWKHHTSFEELQIVAKAFHKNLHVKFTLEGEQYCSVYSEKGSWSEWLLLPLL